MHLKYEFDLTQLAVMDVTISLTMRRARWLKLHDELEAIVAQQWSPAINEMLWGLRDLLLQQRTALEGVLEANR